MSEKTIIFATDFSTASDAALDYASRLAASSSAKLLIVHVQEPPAVYGVGDFYYGVENPDQTILLKMLSALEHPTQPSALSTGCCPAALARACRPGTARAYRNDRDELARTNGLDSCPVGERRGGCCTSANVPGTGLQATRPANRRIDTERQTSVATP